MIRVSELRKAAPRYLEIADILQSEIGRGLYQLDERLPSEVQLCGRFRENRYTIRQALDILLHTGVIRSHQGKGHYVCKKPLDLQYTITPSTRYSHVMQGLGCKPQARLLHQERQKAPAAVAEALRLDADEDVYRLEILRYADSVPLTWNMTWLPVRFVPDLMEHTDSLGSLYELLEVRYGLRLHRIWSTFQATYPTALVAGYLQISPNTNLLQIESVMRDDDHRLVEYTSAKYRGDLCRVSIQFE